MQNWWARNGFFRSRTTESALLPSICKACSWYFAVCTRVRNTRGTELDSRFAKKLSNNTVAGSGSSRRLVLDRASALRFRSESNRQRRTRANEMENRPEILMVDDNPADIDLTREALAQSKGHFHVSAVNDGVEALLFLQREGKYCEAPVPDMVVLDLNLPRKNGCEVLSTIKADSSLARIPVVIFTSSQASSDIARCYKLG